MENIDLRVAKGSITYDRLAAEMNVTRTTVYNWFKKPGLGEVERQRLLNAIREIKEGD
ncbi:MAG TPA: hypothetical protein VI423_03015 [Paenisporosarcina sp.]|nr:hypothetical protein [Paenisporosarcina sp.]